MLPESFASREAGASDTHSFQHTTGSQLIQSILRVERPWPALRVGLDASDEVGLALLESPHEAPQLLAELHSHTDQLEG